MISGSSSCLAVGLPTRSRNYFFENYEVRDLYVCLKGFEQVSKWYLYVRFFQNKKNILIDFETFVILLNHVHYIVCITSD